MKKNTQSAVKYDFNHPIVRARVYYKCNLEDDLTDQEAFYRAAEWLLEKYGEVLLRRAEEEAVVHKDGGLAVIPAHKVFEHITSLTGVE